jgi:hypothetical protein
MIMRGHISRMKEIQNAYRILVGKPEGERGLRMYNRELEDNIKVGEKRIGCETVDWIYLDQDMV